LFIDLIIPWASQNLRFLEPPHIEFSLTSEGSDPETEGKRAHSHERPGLLNRLTEDALWRMEKSGEGQFGYWSAASGASDSERIRDRES
jgi:hypothetical protein